MTPEQFEKIAVWMGWEKHVGGWWVNNYCIYPVVATKTSLTDAEAVEALNRLVEKGYSPELKYEWFDGGFGWCIDLRVSGKLDTINQSTVFPTIPAAVEQALLAMLGKENV